MLGHFPNHDVPVTQIQLNGERLPEVLHLVMLREGDEVPGGGALRAVQHHHDLDLPVKGPGQREAEEHKWLE